MFGATGGTTTVEFDPARATVSVSDAQGVLLEGGLSLVADRQLLPRSAFEQSSAIEGERATYVGTDVPLETSVTLTPADGAVDLRVAVENAGEDPVALQDVRPLTAEHLPAFGENTRVFEHGYQSWSPTGPMPPGERFPAEPDGQRPMMVDPGAVDGPRVSHDLTALSDGDRGLALGFLSGERFLPRFHLTGGRDGADGVDHLGAVLPGEGVTVEPGDRLSLPPLRFAAADVRAGLETVADGVAERMDARVPTETPTGWCSWYQYGQDVTPGDVRENLDAVEALDLPLRTVQVDDGYETAFGDWTTLSAAFGDIGALAADVAAAGRRPGLWLAPFLAESDAAVVEDHPGWVLTDDGEPVDAGMRHGQMVALDPTHPGVQQWLRDTVGTVVDDWGFDYLKLDFLYAAALRGDHHDDDATRAAAYRRGLGAVRQAAGDDTFLLGCGAPMVPSVGLVDAMRVGPDVAASWDDAESGSQPGMRNAARNSLHRQFCHRRWWVNDPDCQLLRPGSDLTDAERRSFAALVALSGGANVISDRLRDLDGDGLALARASLPPVEGGTAVGAGVQPIPDRLVCPRSDGGAAVVAFNWADDAHTLRVDPGEHGAVDAATDGVRGWLPGPGEAVAGPVERERPAHGCLLVHLAPARDRPHVVGAVDHLAAGGSLLDVDWERNGDAGELHLAVDADRPLRLVVATPGDWRAREDHERADGYLVVDAEPAGTTVALER